MREIPPGAVSLAVDATGLWCGYALEDDSLILVFDPDSLEAEPDRLTPPEARCRGLAFRDDSFWFLGAEQIYRLDRNAEIQGHYNAPYEVMTGLTAGGDGSFWTTARLGEATWYALFDSDGDEIDRFRSRIGAPGDLTLANDYLWVTDPAEGVIHKVDIEEEEAVDFIPAPVTSPRGIAFGDSLLYLVDVGAEEEHDLLFVIDPEGEDAPRILTAARFHDFGTVVVNNPTAWNLAIYNIGELDLEIDSVHLARGDVGFRLGNIPGHPVINPGQFLVLRLTFDPDDFGLDRDTLIIDSNDPLDSLVTVALRGVGALPIGYLSVRPDSIDFGLVRADPWRDGSRWMPLLLVNEGVEYVQVDSILFRLVEIFGVDAPELPYHLPPTDTLLVNTWFAPTRGIEFLDTMVVITSHAANIATYVPMRGEGSDSVYTAGTVLWSHHMTGAGGSGTAARIRDLNGDHMDDVIAVAPDGAVACLNGFSSDDADLVWGQDFAGVWFRPEDVRPEGVIVTDDDLDGDGTDDVVFGSGGGDRAVYALSGRDGDRLWRWEVADVEEEGVVVSLSAWQDLAGDGTRDPVVLVVSDDGATGALVTLDGATGRVLWGRHIDAPVGVAPTSDLSHDGIRELMVVTGASRLLTVDGASGALRAERELAYPGGLARIAPTGDLDDDGVDDIILSPGDGGLMGYSVGRDGTIWQIDINLNGAGEAYGVISALHSADGLVVAGTVAGYLLSVDAASGDLAWAVEVAGEPVTLDLIPDLNEDGVTDVLAGTDGGDIHCLDGSEGGEIWSFDGGALRTGAVLHLESFADVDLGGTDDVLAVFADGVVRCISSFGDREVVVGRETPQPALYQLEVHPNPFNDRTGVAITLPERSRVVLTVWDLQGRLLQRLDRGVLPPGGHVIPLDFGNLRRVPSGVYIIRLGESARAPAVRAVMLK